MTASLSVFVNFLIWHRFMDERGVVFLMLVALAAFIALPIACLIERVLFKRSPWTARFAAVFVLLGLGTLGLTYAGSALYSLSYSWGLADPFVSRWEFERFVVSFLAHGYSFAVLGVRWFTPVGPVGLAGLSLLYCLWVDHKKPR